jgi:hypothetical protein
MTKLSDTQSAILNAAIASEDETTTAPSEASRAVAGLIKRGLLVSIPQADGLSRLMITATGREAVAPSPVSEKIETAPDPVRASPKPRGPYGPTTAISYGPPEPPVDVEETASPTDPVLPRLPKGKIGALVGLLRQEGGTTVEAMMAATGWQAHSVRGALSGVLKKGLGHKLINGIPFCGEG